MHKMFRITAAAAALLSASAAMAQVQTPPARPHGPPPEMEQSGPGAKGITRAAALAHAAERFDAADTNKDGILSHSEMRAAREHGPHGHGRPDGGPDGRRGPPPGGEFGPRGQGSNPPPPVGEQR
jgi:hypothetical protein